MTINENSLIELIDDVVLPFHHYLEKLDATKRDLDSNEKRLKHELDTTILAIALIKNPEYAKEKLQKSSAGHNDLNISYKEMRDALNIFFKLLIDFLRKKGKSKELEKQLDSYNEFFMKAYTPKKTQEDENQESEEDFFDDDFFDFDSEEVDEEINKMHFEEHEKISAQEFMQSGVINEDHIADIADLLEDFDNKSSHVDFITTNYIEDFGKTISGFKTIFTLSYEFQNIAYALDKLYKDLFAYDITYLKGDQKELSKLLLDSIIADLVKFQLEVLIEQTAVDIHYLDASLLANVAQIEIIFNEIKGE